MSTVGRGLIGTATGKSVKLELGSAFFMAGWGRAARELDGEAADVLNYMEVITRWPI